MNVPEFMIGFAPTLFAGSTVVLSVGVCAMMLSRSLIQRKRLATTTLLVFLGWVALAVLPMRRPLTEIVPTTNAPPARGATPVPIPLLEPTLRQSSGNPLALDSTKALPAPAEGAVSFTDVVVSILVLGSVLSGAYLALAWMVLRRRVARARIAPSRVLRFARELGFEVKRLRILVTDERTRPYCFGLNTPTIVLPADLCRHECRERLRAVLLHEFCHITGKDLRDQALLAFCLPLLYWHPLFWVLRHRLRLAAEMIADERATQRLDRKIYIRELIGLVDQPARPLPLAPALPVLGLESEFYRRMNMLLQRTRPLTTRCSAFHIVLHRLTAATVLTAVTLSWGTLPAQEGNAPIVQSQDAPAVVGTYHYWITGTYPTPTHLENMLLCVGNLGFKNTGLRVGGKGGSSSRSFFVKLSYHAKNPKLARHLTSKVRKLWSELDTIGITVSRNVPRRPVVGAENKAPMKKVSITVSSTEIREVIATIAKSAGINIAVAKEVEGKVTLRLKDVPWRDALEIACLSASNVRLQEERGVLRVVRMDPAKIAKAPRVYFAFQDAPIQKVIDTIAKISGANIVVSPKVEGEITLRLRNIPWRDALEAACKTLGYVVVQEDRGILRVAPASAPR